jgi:hypothetical protein
MGTKRFMQIFVGCFVIAASFLGFVIEAKAETLATSAEKIFGTWVTSSCWAGTCYMRFDKDGTMREAFAPDKLDSQPYAINSYEFKGTKIFLTEVRVVGVPPCGPAIVGTYEIHLLESGNIRIVAINDQCGGRTADMQNEYKPVR